MLINLRQWIGRLKRTAEDKGDIYILDPRMYNNKWKLDKIIEVLKKSGKIMEEKIKINIDEKIGLAS